MAEAAEQQPEALADSVPEPTDAEVERYFETQGGEVDAPEGEGADSQAAAVTPQEGDNPQKPAASGTDSQQASKADGEGDKAPPGYVPVKALQEIREERAALRAELEAIKKRLEPAPKAEENTDPEPDKDSDLAGWLEWRTRQVDARAEKLEKASQQQAEVRQREEAMQAVRSEVGRQEGEFRATQPDYDDAYAYAYEHERRLIEKVQGITDKAEQDRRIRANEQSFVMQALQAGRNPAQALYEYATLAGYKRQDRPAAPEQPAGGQTGRKEAPKSLGAARTAPAGDAMTPEGIASLSDTAFEKLVSTKAGREQVNKVMGDGFVNEF